MIPAIALDKPSSYALMVDAAADLAAIYDPDVQLVVWQRPLNAELRSYWQRAAEAGNVGRRIVARDGALPEDLLPDLPGVETAWSELRFVDWLFRDLCEVRTLGVRIECSQDRVCPRFHVDHVALRLLCTWKGPGSEWVDDAQVDRRFLGAGSRGLPDEQSGLLRPGAKIWQIPEQAIALCKGDAWAGNERRGVVHRSPAVAPADGARVLLALDLLED
ncbi:DUF1826 domain-containing protein [Candidatus Igneacidithiobacillus taiwanensis]|uniref:DUF1826 domain-containing protein n=1 Tax=Candidatus Igneacidithiobacillus taiwanensis TaxID=1945924 RepID=UPI0028A29BA5|nr:DUF1826 domain-containing protein [Candidatus Igneacidithiobacillus taiwanensis]MCE5359539.1 DUF1826 domain-containing protein [Acidithiobacillus sp.]